MRILRIVDGITTAACVGRAWRQLAWDERLWEAACTQDWASLGYSDQTLRWFITSIGGFCRLHGLHWQHHGAGAQRGRMNRGQVQFSLSLLSTSFFHNMPNARLIRRRKTRIMTRMEVAGAGDQACEGIKPVCLPNNIITGSPMNCSLAWRPIQQFLPVGSGGAKGVVKQR
jgi:hypothetical protein